MTNYKEYDNSKDTLLQRTEKNKLNIEVLEQEAYNLGEGLQKVNQRVVDLEAGGAAVKEVEDLAEALKAHEAKYDALVEDVNKHKAEYKEISDKVDMLMALNNVMDTKEVSFGEGQYMNNADIVDTSSEKEISPVYIKVVDE